MFSRSAIYYDKIYSAKNYQAEVQKLLPFIQTHLQASGRRLLDVACGTGGHIQYLKQSFDTEGLDISAELLALARQNNPDVKFHLGDIMDFNLGEQFDVITCLFSSIGYVKTLENLYKAFHCLNVHLKPGGVLIIEPWFTPDKWQPGTVHAILIDESALKIARVNTSFSVEKLSYFDLHYLIGTPTGTEHFVERHELGLFEIEEMEMAFQRERLAVIYDVEGITGRGLFIGKKQV